MEKLTHTLDTIIDNIKDMRDSIDSEQADDMVRFILGASRVFVFGAGRSGLVGKAFAMRLMHLGKEVHVIGETITPPVFEDDAVVCITGSGRTKSVVNIARIACSVGAKVIVITSNQEGPISEFSTTQVLLSAKTKDDVKTEDDTEEDDYIARQLARPKGIVALGTMFELSVMVFLDSLISEFMDRLGQTEVDLKRRHANIE